MKFNDMPWKSVSKSRHVKPVELQDSVRVLCAGGLAIGVPPVRNGWLLWTGKSHRSQWMKWRMIWGYPYSLGKPQLYGTPFSMGKSTISMVIFNSKLLVYQILDMTYGGWTESCIPLNWNPIKNGIIHHNPPINWCGISSIHGMTIYIYDV